ncbi:hypothetical protein [Novosphingobium sp. BL-52-GroH]|uniref:hypothetical protein n=1 Tax=Novosphingobium sp. BL-52-GroH TaxID=3349877 RepID=UPI00384B79C1
MRKTGRSWRTPLLVAVVLTLAAANLWWFVLRTPEPPKPAFELGRTDGSTLGVDAAEALSVPLFDPVHDRWTVNGAVVTDLPSRVRRSQPADDYHAAGFLMVRIADDADTEQVRRALLSLTQQHICWVALVDQVKPMSDGKVVPTPVHRIVSVRDNDGNVVACTRP